MTLDNSNTVLHRRPRTERWAWPLWPYQRPCNIISMVYISMGHIHNTFWGALAIAHKRTSRYTRKSYKILDVGDSVQLPVLTTTSRALEPNSETGRSRSLVRKRGTTCHNQSALLTVLTLSSENLNFIFLTHVLMFELFMYMCTLIVMPYRPCFSL